MLPPIIRVFCSHFVVRNPKKVIFQQYYSYILQIIYVISEGQQTGHFEHLL